MNRLTKNISDKQTYCGYEIKELKYQQIYDFKKYDELEDYVDCDLTLTIDKLGELEDLEEQLYNVPLKFILKHEHKQVYWNNAYHDVRNIVPYEKYTEPYVEIFVRENNKVIVKTLWFKNYKKTWWLKEDMSE